jgi:hypothetical protein
MVDQPNSRRLWALGLLAFIAGCSGSGGSGGSGGTSFSEVYSTIIGSRCVPCHSVGVGKISGMLDMSSEDTAYSNLVGVMAAGVSCGKSGLTRVVAGSAQTSLLFDKVNSKLPGHVNPACGDPMPDDATVLTQAEVDLIATWINDGAQK